MRFQFGVRQAIGVSLLLFIAVFYIVIRAKGLPAHTLTPVISVIAPLATLIAFSGKRSGCCGRRKLESEA